MSDLHVLDFWIPHRISGTQLKFPIPCQWNLRDSGVYLAKARGAVFKEQRAVATSIEKDFIRHRSISYSTAGLKTWKSTSFVKIGVLRLTI